MAATPPPKIELGDTHGALLITSYISTIMYGMVLLQLYLYFTRFLRDPTFLKVLVACMGVADTVQTTFTIIASYWWLITNYMNPPALLVGYWSFDSLFHVDPILALFAQAFYARRVWAVSRKNKPLCAFLFTAVLIRFGLFHAMGAEVWIRQTFDSVADILWLFIIGLGWSLVTDVAISASLVYYLHNSRTGFNRTDSLINRFILYSVTTALFPCIMDIVVVICIATMPRNLIYPGMHLILTKTYPNTLLATLNLRESNRGWNAQELRSVVDNSTGGATGSTLRISHPTFKKQHLMEQGVLVTQESYVEPWTSTIIEDSNTQARKPLDAEP